MTIYRNYLRRVYKLIRTKKRWAKGCWATDKDGLAVISTDRRACRWCLGGAAKACGLSLDAFSTALRFKTVGSIFTFNDRSSHKQVLARLKLAIDRAPVRENAP